MAKHIQILAFLTITCIVVFSDCHSKTENSSRKNQMSKGDSVKFIKDSINDPVVLPKKKQIQIYGDTVWVQPYANKVWYDSISYKDFKVFLSVWVDTTDYIIDTVASSKGNRIVIGYNHHYNLQFLKNNRYWFSVIFNKKDDLKSLLSDTEFWLESNIDVFQKVFYNRKYNKVIVQYAINPRYSFGATYYFIFSTKGRMEYAGKAGSWGGGDPDGEAFLTGDQEMFITSNELYSFNDQSYIDISDLSFLPNSGVKDGEYINLIDIHAYKPLTDSTFLLIFNRSDITPEYNAYVLKTDISLLGKFKYYGVMEEMDAMLLFEHSDMLNSYFLYDTDRKTLIRISDSGKFLISEQSIWDLKEIESDTLPENSNFTRLSFDVIGLYQFFFGANDSLMYYQFEKFE